MKKIFLIILFNIFLFGAVGKITALVGDAYIIRNSNQIHATLGSEIENKDTIITKQNTKLQIMFKDDSVITIGENSKFKVEDYFFDNSSNSKFKNINANIKTPRAKFKLENGVIKTLSGKIGQIAPEKFRIETKNVSIGIRGTYFAVKFKNNISVVNVLEGKVFVIDKINKKIFDLVGGETLELKAAKGAKPKIKKGNGVNVVNINSNTNANVSCEDIKSDQASNKIAANSMKTAYLISNISFTKQNNEKPIVTQEQKKASNNNKQTAPQNTQDSQLKNTNNQINKDKEKINVPSYNVKYLLEIPTPSSNLENYKKFLNFNSYTQSIPILKNNSNYVGLSVININLSKDGKFLVVEANFLDASKNSINCELTYEVTENGFILKNIKNSGKVKIVKASLNGKFYGKNAEILDIEKLSMFTQYGNEYATIPTVVWPSIAITGPYHVFKYFELPYYKIDFYGEGIKTPQKAIEYLSKIKVKREYEDGIVVNFNDLTFDVNPQKFSASDKNLKYIVKSMNGKIKRNKLFIDNIDVYDSNGNKLDIKRIYSNLYLYSPNVSAIAGTINLKTKDGKKIEIIIATSALDNENIGSLEAEVGYFYDKDGNKVGEYIDGLQTSIDEINNLINKKIKGIYGGLYIGNFNNKKISGSMVMHVNFAERSVSSSMIVDNSTITGSGKINPDTTFTIHDLKSYDLGIKSGQINGKFYGLHAESIAGHIDIKTSKGNIKGLYNIRR